MGLQLGNQLTLSIEDLSRGGSGVAKTPEGQTVFVPYTLAGDVVKVKIVEIKRRHALAEIVTFNQLSPERQSPRCDVFTRCGGCQWQHVPYSLQWSTKLEGVRHSLGAVKIRSIPKPQEFPANNIWNYRNRIQMRGKGSQLGFYAERSHNIVPVTQCAIASPEINQALDEIRQQGSAYNKEYKVEIEVGEDGTIHSHWDSPHAAGGFRQVNEEQNRKLIDWVTQVLGKQQFVYDLYGGSANLSLELAEKGVTVHCVDQTAKHRQPGEPPGTLHFHNEDVLSWLKNRITDLAYKRIPEPSAPWSAIIDPPRGGMGNNFDDIMSRLDRLRVNSIVLVGCKTDTWARDIAKLQQREWKLKSMAVFDFFPHTPHVESTAYLVR